MRNMKEALHELQGKIGYQFQDETLLKQALTHSSFANEQKINKLNNYERLEFLGDAVLELVSSEFLYNENEDMPEGQLTRLRASMVCEPALAYCARDIQLNTYILLGKGEESTGGRKRDSITSDVMEAVIGAIFIDGGIEHAKSLSIVLCSRTWRTRFCFWTARHFCRRKSKKRTRHSFGMSWWGRKDQTMTNSLVWRRISTGI